MCIVVDVGALPPVFDEGNQEHAAFAPVKEWILKGQGKLVYGGSTYLRELKTMHRYVSIVNDLKDMRKVCVISSAKVDQREQQLKHIKPCGDFNDHHVMAILSVSGCRLVCSSNTSHVIKGLEDARFFPVQRRRPRLYNQSASKELLCRKYVVELHNLE